MSAFQNSMYAFTQSDNFKIDIHPKLQTLATDRQNKPHPPALPSDCKSLRIDYRIQIPVSQAFWLECFCQHLVFTAVSKSYLDIDANIFSELNSSEQFQANIEDNKSLSTVKVFKPTEWKIDHLNPECTKAAARINSKGRAVLITGCDTGFGHLLAKQLDEMGFRAFAGCLFPDRPGAQRLKKECSIELNILKLDVTLDEDVVRAKEFVQPNLPAEGLWGLVNNAGDSGRSEVEWSNIQIYQRQADVDLRGSIRMAIAFIPLLRQSKGHFVFMSSQTAYIHPVACSTFVITKYGLKAFSDCLRLEMRKFGVEISIIEPGNDACGTNIVKEKTKRKKREELWNKLNDTL
ncbi:D-beta-hydroxybutyrate dehydrogenase, mitochondrial-like [Cetorhinus maximus]